MPQFDVTPKVLRWAREDVALSQEDVAYRLKVPPDRIERWERGDEPVTAGAVEKLAKLYGRPIAVFCLDEPPPSEAIPRDFRTIAGQPVSRSRDVVVAVRRARQWQRNIARLREGFFEVEVASEVPEFDLGDEPESIGGELRNRLRVTSEQQMRWPTVGHALSVWRDRVEALGVLTFSMRLKRQVCRGFSLWSADDPPVVVLATESPQAKIFTLMHEVGHLTLRQGGICLQTEDQTDRGQVERFCNRVAAAVLMPAGLTKDLATRLFSPPRWDREELRELAQHLKVSIPAVALRLEELDLAPIGLFQRMFAPDNADDQAPGSGGGQWPGVKISEMGRTYSQTIFRAWERGLINTADAALAMSMPPQYVPLMGEALSRRRDRFGD